MSLNRQGGKAWETATTWRLTPYTTAFAARQGQGKQQEQGRQLCGGWHPDGLGDRAVGPEGGLWARASR
jgi:hypothetical protein